MGMTWEFLDSETRAQMLAELDLDEERGRLFLSPRLSAGGQRDWPMLIRAALTWHDDDWLADQLDLGERLVDTELRRVGGERKRVRTPRTAAAQLATDQFNRYYIRALCRRALESEIPYVVVVRGRMVEESRPFSRQLLNLPFDPSDLLEDMRQGTERSHFPPGPNSGLTVRLPQQPRPEHKAGMQAA